MFCLVKDSCVSEWVILARLTASKGNLTPEIANHRIPLEMEDIRFRRSTLYLPEGFRYYRSESDIAKGKSVVIPQNILDTIALDLAGSHLGDCIFSEQDKRSLREFFLGVEKPAPPVVRVLTLEELAGRSSRFRLSA